MNVFLDWFCLAAALVLHEAAQSATVAASPFSWGFEVPWLLSVVALVLLVAATCLPLVVLPVWDTLSAGRVSRSRMSLIDSLCTANGYWFPMLWSQNLVCVTWWLVHFDSSNVLNLFSSAVNILWRTRARVHIAY